MLRPTTALAGLLLASTPPLAAQAGSPGPSRVLLVPQLGVPVGGNQGSSFVPSAAIVAELPLTRRWSLSVEGMAALGEESWVCLHQPGDPCNIPTSLRFGLSAGIVAQPGRVGPLAPFAGVSAGAVRWRRSSESGDAPMASLRAGLDVQIAGSVGARLEFVRRIAWTGTRHGSPLHANAVSVGARFALRR